MTRALVVVMIVLGGCKTPLPDPEESRAVQKLRLRKAMTATLMEIEAAVETKARAECRAIFDAELKKMAPKPPVTTGPAPTPFERHGYRNAAGEVVIPAKYTLVTEFEDQVAAVLDDDGWSFIDRGGNELAVPFLYDNAADDFSEGRARIVEGDRYGFLANTGEIVVPPTWSFVERYSGGHAAVCEGCVKKDDGEHFVMTGGKWGYVDLGGKLVISPRFETAGSFVEGRATVEENGRSLVIGTDGAEKK